MKYGETLNFSLDKQMERVVEVLALSALVANDSMRNESLQKLREIAFPLEIDLEWFAIDAINEFIAAR